jgi:hypothetical protein
VAPNPLALASIATWAVLTALALGWIGLRSRSAARGGFGRVAA